MFFFEHTVQQSHPIGERIYLFNLYACDKKMGAVKNNDNLRLEAMTADALNPVIILNTNKRSTHKEKKNDAAPSTTGVEHDTILNAALGVTAVLGLILLAALFCIYHQYKKRFRIAARNLLGNVGRDGKLISTELHDAAGSLYNFLLQDESTLQVRAIAFIDKGGIGEVRKAVAVDGQNEKTYAVKIITNSTGDKNEILVLCKQLTLLSHCHVLRYHAYDVVTCLNQIRLLQDYCDGGDLAHVIHEIKHCQDMIINYAIQMSEGVEYLHGQGIVHCDLKPKNIFLTANNCLKIGDLDSAIKQPFPGLSVFGDTKVGGTCGYSSPELIQGRTFRGNPCGRPSDIWSLGIIFIEMSIGCLPDFHSVGGQLLNPLTMVQEYQRTKQAPLCLQLVLEYLSPTIYRASSECIVMDAEDRYDCSQLLDVLRG